MKKLFFILSLISFQLFAAELNLKVGESAVIQPNTLTTVTCGAGSGGQYKCVKFCKGGYYNDGSCVQYGPDYCAINAVCIKNCTGGYYNDGSCVQYGPDKCFSAPN